MIGKLKYFVKPCKYNFHPFTKKIVLYDVALPLIFAEVWSVALAFFVVVLIEAWIIKNIIKVDFSEIIGKIIYVNFLTTIVGYFLQGIGRIIILSLALKLDMTFKNQYVQGLAGNVGSTHTGIFDIVPIASAVEIGASFIIAFILSVVIETRSLKRKYDGNKDIQRLIPSATLKANIASYTLLLIWVFYYVKSNF